MRKTILTCDRCGETSERRDFLLPVTVTTKSSNSTFTYELAIAEWCDKCLREVRAALKLPEEPPKPDEPAPQRMTIEDLIREIVREEVQ